MENKPCVSPFTFKLEDCLACSSCISDFNVQKVLSYNDLKDEELTFLLSPHSKMSMFGHYKRDTFINFEYKLAGFIKMKFKTKKIYDTSYIKNVLFDCVYKQTGKVIISDCPGTVSYIERQAHHLLKYLSVTKSQQQALLTSKTLSVVQCYDKMMENPYLVMTTFDFYKMIVEEGFLDFEIQGHCEEWEKCRIKNHYGYLEYILNRRYSNNEYTTINNENTTINNENTIINNEYTTINNENTTINNENTIINNDNIKGNNFKSRSEDIILNDLQYESKNGVYIYTLKMGGTTQKYIRILGLEPFLNFIKETKNGMNYEVCEIYICNQGCINGPGQIYTNNNQFFNNIEIEIKEDIKIEADVILNLEERIYKKKVNKKVNFKVEW